MNIADAPPNRVGFLLIPGFALMSYAAAMEPLRAANVLSGRPLYDWFHVSGDGAPVAASNGASVMADYRIGDTQIDFDTVFVCAGGNPALFDEQRTFGWLRGLARKGCRIAGVSGGPYILARAGLLGGYRCTVHWAHVPAFEEEFPAVSVSPTLFEIDRDRLTCAGGIAALDMMHALIEAEHGHSLAAAVSDWFLHGHAREGSGPQRMALRERYDVHHPKLLMALERMERRLDRWLDREDLAKAVGLSLRQLERLFRAQLGTTVAGHHLALRLERAEVLLHQTAMPVMEVAIACGFVSASHFARAFHARFGRSPRVHRPQLGPSVKQQASIPEHRSLR
ncbi:MAG: GlxA family transcriptional regulator [Beijerinckiaceae bacterium]